MTAIYFNHDKNEIQTEDVKIQVDKNDDKSSCCLCFKNFFCGDGNSNPVTRAIKILVLGNFVHTYYKVLKMLVLLLLTLAFLTVIFFK